MAGSLSSALEFILVVLAEGKLLALTLPVHLAKSVSINKAAQVRQAPHADVPVPIVPSRVIKLSSLV